MKKDKMDFFEIDPNVKIKILPNFDFASLYPRMKSSDDYSDLISDLLASRKAEKRKKRIENLLKDM